MPAVVVLETIVLLIVPQVPVAAPQVLVCASSTTTTVSSRRTLDHKTPTISLRVSSENIRQSDAGRTGHNENRLKSKFIIVTIINDFSIDCRSRCLHNDYRQSI